MRRGNSVDATQSPVECTVPHGDVVARLNDALAEELDGVLRHLRRRHGLGGWLAEAHDPLWRRAEIAQQDHALALTERIVALGGEPVLSPSQAAGPAAIAGLGPNEPLRQELIASRDAARFYRALIRDLDTKDPVTVDLLENICAWKDFRAAELAELLAEGLAEGFDSQT